MNHHHGAHRVRSILSGAILLALSHTTYAQEASDEPTIVVSAARSAQVVTDALPDTTIIGRDAIEKSPASDVVGLLKMQSGLVIRQSGPQGNAVSVNIRGGDPRQTLVLIDGVPMNSLSAGTGALEQLPLSAIERIEIVRGNVSALYGSQATGGMVQIFTRRAKLNENDATIRVAGGTHGQRQMSAQVRGGNDKVQVTVGISHDEVKAVSAQNVVQTAQPAQPTSPWSPAVPATFANADKDGYRNDSANAHIRYHPNANHELGLHFLESRGKNNYDNEYSLSATSIQYNKTHVQNISLYSNDQITQNWKSNLRLSQYTDRSDDYDNAPRLDFDQDGYTLYKARTKEIFWQNNIHTKIGEFIVGISRTNQRLTTDSQYSETFRGTTSLWTGYMLDKNQHHLQLNARTDKITAFARENTASANYAYDVSNNWRMLVGYSNGFSAPTLNDLYSAFGNSKLKPEYANYTTLGVQYQKSGFTGRLTAFETRYRNKIAYDPSTFTTANIERVKAKGIEWHGSYTNDGWTADIGLTYQEVKNRATGQRLLRQPRVLASVALGKTWGKWTTQLDWLSQGDMRDYPQTTSGYGVFNASAYYAPTKKWKLGLSVGNILNRKYNSLYGYNSMPRNVLLSLQYQPQW